MAGRIKITGNILAAQKLQEIWRENSDSKTNQTNADVVDDDDRKLLESIPKTGLKSDLIFTILRNRMHEEPEFIRRMTAAYQFNITSDGKHRATWCKLIQFMKSISYTKWIIIIHSC